MFYKIIVTALTSIMLSTNALAELKAPLHAVTPPKATANQTAVKVNLNSASAAELMAVKGMSASKVKALIAYRKKQGEIKSFDELKQIRGFKRLTDDALKEIQEQLVLS